LLMLAVVVFWTAAPGFACLPAMHPSVPHQAGLESAASPGAGYRNAFQAPPPKFPPGCSSILRI
jgi:hypothetical protein